MLATLKKPGLARGALGGVIGAAFGFAFVVAIRKLSGLPATQTEQTGYPQLIVALITGPFGFLIGLGAFDYWFRWAAGGPTYPPSTTGSAGQPAGQHIRPSWSTRTTVPPRGATTSSSTPITR